MECQHHCPLLGIVGQSVSRVLCREDIQLDLTGWDEAEGELRTRWRFNAILQLPWRPRLAAAGGTTHVFSPVTAQIS